MRRQWCDVREDVLAAVARVGASGWLVLGEEVLRFERALAERWGLPHCVGCASGLDGIEIALRIAGLRPGEAVLTTPLSAFATTLAIVRAGGRPCFADVDESGLLDLDLAERVLEAHPEVRWLLPVHLYGHAVDLDRLERLRRRFELHIVEDCAQAIDARSHRRPVGSVSDACATSFYPTKNLGAMGDGGAVLTRSRDAASAAAALRDYGRTGRDEHAVVGLNSRLDALQAAILFDAFLPRLDHYVERRRKLADGYRSAVRHPEITIPPTPPASDSVWHLFPVLANDRDAFRDHLTRCGVATLVHYPQLIPDQPALADVDGVRVFGSLPRARYFADHVVSLPIHPYLDDGCAARIAEACTTWRS